MIRTILLWSFLFLLSTSVKAQTFEFDFNDFDTCGIWNQDDSISLVLHGHINNLHFTTNNLYWQVTPVYLPAGWKFAICDNVACYTDNFSERFMNLSTGENGTMNVYIRTFGNPGDSAVLELCVWEINDTTTAECHLFTFTECSSSTADNVHRDIHLSISPNPTSDYFHVNSSERVGNVDVYNIIGSKVKAFDEHEVSPYRVADLPAGMYLVRIYNESNTQVLSTLRLKKR